ncbi:MAG: hypothetical protein HY007_03200 [Candidatus Sungbacteria bacterium]|nr:hypothetical protein [Candidatus Sungbacteria bacterium]
MKGVTVTRIILEKLQEVGEGTLETFFPKNYAYAALWRPLLGLDKPRKITHHTISMNLSRLKREGLVEKSGTGRKSGWRLTTKGKKYIAKQPKRLEMSNLRKDGITRLVIFDIPERERRKRDIIRAELVCCKFKRLQKSVWIGEYPLPQEFISLLDSLHLAQNVHIFSIREEGTLGFFSKS